ncbi:hypothetical protein PPYR_01738 [Photinus pyralis]|uniref:Uncharacterized protein n=1 Tax=Photinus pyralis TaxID=7054 RepID=A0A5N4B5E6_PHOPY|nr:intraflagellar transport protein 52 homolog [Photinus pyralis]XP_031328974.1 intraflagellar transport protein 52 homolog [Photinus pyralis]XP_031328975.1 intraflagellar transport protein 52 homolog [Photinus pyralis]KAB0804768.1 hypothetical protein PPYR_01738 [Photinus pyralis]
MAPIEINFDNKSTIIFNATKNELFKLNDNFKILQRKLKINWKLVVNKEEINDAVLQKCSILILPGCRNPFSESEIEAMKKYLDQGGKILVLLYESNQDDISNVNIILEHYGMVPNMDSLIRTHYYKYFHPKECYIEDGNILEALTKEKVQLNLVVPHGCTLNVNKPSVIVFTSGATTFPADRPLCGMYYNGNTGGTLVTIGSGHMFADKYIDQEHNEKFREYLFEFLASTDKVSVITDHDDDLEIWDHHIVPDITEIADRAKLCLTDAIGHAISTDYSKLFDHKMYSMNTDFVPQAVKLYDKLDVKHQTLKLISPNFEAPLPPLQAAVFPPSFRELPPPPLELFDLDEAFSSSLTRLAQFTNKFLSTTPSNDPTDQQLDFYIQECAKIVNVGIDSTDSKDILFEVATQCNKFKQNSARKQEEIEDGLQ